MNELDLLSDLGPEQELNVLGNGRCDIPMVTVSKTYHKLFLNVATVRALRGIKKHVKVGKAKGYLLFHFTDDSRYLSFTFDGNSGAVISISKILSISGIRVEQLDRKTPVLIQDGFAVPYL